MQVKRKLEQVVLDCIISRKIMLSIYAICSMRIDDCVLNYDFKYKIEYKANIFN